MSSEPKEVSFMAINKAGKKAAGSREPVVVSEQGKSRAEVLF